MGKHWFCYRLRHQFAALHLHEIGDFDYFYFSGLRGVSFQFEFHVFLTDDRKLYFNRYGLIEYRFWQKQKNLEVMLSDWLALQG